MRLISLEGSVASMLARPFPDPLAEAEAWFFEPTAPALVLGSSQRDLNAPSEPSPNGMTVVRRRSGGGAVLVLPRRSLWVDVVLPPSDLRWTDDVRKAPHWLGEAWAAALQAVGFEPEVHRGGLLPSPWGSLVCFGSLGPGEVAVGGKKVVGISQRRTRLGARFQCIAYADWRPGEVLGLIDLDDIQRVRAQEALADVAMGVGDCLPLLGDALAHELALLAP